MPKANRTIISFVSAFVALLAGCGSSPPRAGAAFTALPHSSTVPLYGVIEFPFQDSVGGNPLSDGRLTAEFTAPDGSREARAGFHAGNGIWMVRFAPGQVGTWSYSIAFEQTRIRQNFNGRFESVPSTLTGPIRRDAANPHRWLSAIGEPYFPLGIQDCIEVIGNEMYFDVDGLGRNDGSKRRLTADEYFALYSQAGFNLFRYSQRNCSPALFDSLDFYREADMGALDKLLATARKHGFRIMFGFFGYHGHWHDGTTIGRVWHALRVRAGAADEALENPADQRTMAKEMRFIDYAIARWGEYVDFWELLNERRAHEQWTRAMASHVRAIDPGRKPVTTSWDEPELPELDLLAPHWYVSEPLRESDLRVVRQAEKWKRYGKPVLFGEHGNTGMNWDPQSAIRMRVRLWTALFQELGLVLWNTSWAKQGMFQGKYTPGESANIYLGPEERSYTRALRSFKSRLHAGLQMAPVSVSAPDQVRGYALISDRQTAVYLWHFDNPASGISVDVTLPAVDHLRTGEWILPATGTSAGAARLLSRRRSLRTPAFRGDMALLLSHSAGAR